jgi:RNA ligase (TIGR02306 family)
MEGKNVVITEKIHGANARYCWRDDKFWVGSHKNAKKLDGANIWTAAAKRHNLEEVCKAHPGLLLFGEVFGQVQKGYEYDRKGPSFVLFDILDLFLEAGPEWLKWDHVTRFANENNLLHVPELYRGPWVSLEHAATFADGPTVLGNGKHNREGCVVKADPECWHEFLGRVVVKVIGEEYLLRKYS